MYVRCRAFPFQLRVWAVLVGVTIVVAGCGASPQSSLGRLSAVVSLFDQDKIVHNFSHMRTLFNTADIAVTRQADPLPLGKEKPPSGYEDWRTARSVTGIVVLRDGKNVFENYYLGTQQNDQRISWSVAKSYISVLIGIAIEKGQIQSVEDLASDYVPELADSPYKNVTIENLLHMSSGVEFDERYQVFTSDINKMGRVLALGGSMDVFVLEPRGMIAEPGARWKYVSIDTHVLGMVLRRATGQSLADLVGSQILNPLGVYGKPYYVTDTQGVAFALGGLNLTTRDYALFGEMVRLNGTFNGRRIVSQDWIKQSTRPSAHTATGNDQYGYHWWMPADARDGEFFARGVYGQFIYIDRVAGVVIALNSADRDFLKEGVSRQNIEMMRAIADKAR